MADELPPVVTYPPDAILEIAHVAHALHTTVEKVRAMDLPYFKVGQRERFLWSQVLEVLADRAMPKEKKSMRRVG